MGTLEILATSYLGTDHYSTRLKLLNKYPLYYRQTEHPLTEIMAPKNTLADAWEDDWESLADVRMPLFFDSNALTTYRKKTRSP